MERSGYTRAQDLLSTAQGARWLARLSAVGASLMSVYLILLGALFVDLLVHQGRIPTYQQISAAEQESLPEIWHSYPVEERQEALKRLGALSLEKLEMPPPPSQADSKTLKEWAKKRNLTGDVSALALQEWEIYHRGAIWLYLKHRVSESAADRYLSPLSHGGSEGTLPPPSPVKEPTVRSPFDPESYGLLSLAVRVRDSWLSRPIGILTAFSPWGWSHDDANHGLLLGLFILGVLGILLRGGFVILLREMAARASLEAVIRLRRNLYHHNLRVSTFALTPAQLEEPTQLFTKHVDHLHESLYFDVGARNRLWFQIILFVGIGLLAHPFLGVAALILGAVVWSLAGQFTANLRQGGRSMGRVAQKKLLYLLESLRLIGVVKTYLMEAFNQARVERQLTEYAQAFHKRYRGESLGRPILILFAGLATAIFLLLAGLTALRGGVSLPGLFIILVSTASLYFPIKLWSEGKKIRQKGEESAEEIHQFFERRGDVVTYPEADFLPGISRTIEFNEVTLKDRVSGELLLDKVNLKIRAGQKVGIVGPDQSSKLALVTLLPRWTDPTSGEIKIDGRALKWLTLDSLRSQIGLVLSDHYVFNDTVANNIGCGDPGFALPQIIEAAKLAHAHQFIQRLPYGYETPIGEMGHLLTSGEKFRVALARAILRDPSLYIIEEPPEHLDDDTKDLVDDTLNRIMPNKTIIFLPHRMSTLRDCDTLFLIHEGKLVASGDHKQLIVENEFYRHLYYVEFNPFAEASSG
jgi:ATP-binding cassette subfamily B protein